MAEADEGGNLVEDLRVEGEVGEAREDAVGALLEDGGGVGQGQVGERRQEAARTRDGLDQAYTDA